MIISDTLECFNCKKRLCECKEHLVYYGHSFCSTDCILDYIDKDIEDGGEVISEEEYKNRMKCKQAEWLKDARG